MRRDLKNWRKERAEERKTARAERSDLAQIKLLNERPGNSKKEIDRLLKRINSK